MSDNTVFVVKAIVGAAVICTVQKAVHLVLVKINHTYIAVAVLVIDIICAGLAV